MSKNVLRKVLKIITIFIGALLLILIGVIASLRFEGVQNFAKTKLITYLEDKIGTDVSLERVYVKFPSNISMHNLFLQGEDVDTLLYAGNLEVRLNLWDLTKNKANISAIDLSTLQANVVRDTTGRFNFDYIIDAFATENQSEQKKESKPFIISLDKINLDEINVHFIDNQSGNDLSVAFAHFDTRVKEFDLYQNNYAISTINMDSLRLNLEQDIVKEVAKNTVETLDSLAADNPLNIELGAIHLTNFDIRYHDIESQTKADIIFDELFADVTTTDLQNNTYEADKLLLTNANLNANLFIADNGNTSSNSANSSTSSSIPEILIKNAKFDNVNIEYNNTAKPKSRRGIDFNHLNVTPLNLEISDLAIAENNYSGIINSAKIREQSGINIQELTTHFAYTDETAYLKELYFKTPKSLIRNHAVLTYDSLNQLANNIGQVSIDANLDNSTISFSDILLFAPQLATTAPFNTYPNESINITTRLKGAINNLRINELVASGFDGTKVNVSGTLNNTLNTNQLQYDLAINNLQTSSKTIYNLVPAGTIPTTIELPEEFNIKGNATGSLSDVKANLQLASSLGNADVDGNIHLQQKGNERYNVHLITDELDIGTIIKNEQLGVVTGNITANGIGFDPSSANAKLSGNIQSFGFNNYTYQDLSLDGEIQNGVYDIDLLSKDSNANLHLAANGVYNETSPTIKLDGTVNELNLQALNFMDETFIFAGEIQSDVTNFSPDALNGVLEVNGISISNGETIYPLNQIKMVAKSTTDSNFINLKSDILIAELNGHYNVTQVGGAVLKTINNYYQFQPNVADSLSSVIEPNQFFTLDATLYNGDFVQQFVPDLKSFDDITIHADYVADSEQLDATVTIPNVVYQTYEIENGHLVIETLDDALAYNLNIEQLGNEKLAVQTAKLNGDLANNVLTYQLSTESPETETTNYTLNGKAKLDNGKTIVSLANKQLLNFETWTVPSNNSIEVSQQGIYVNDFKLQKNGSQIAVQSVHSQPNSPIEVDINNFTIKTITEFVTKDTLLADGIINGSALINNLTTGLTADADITISDLNVYENPVGELAVEATLENQNSLQLNSTLTGYNNDVAIDGSFNLNTQSPDLAVQIQQLQMETLQAFSLGEIQNGNGYLSGDLTINGTTSNPKILGELHFNDVSMLVNQLGTTFQDIDDTIQFTENAIAFNQFSIADEAGSELVINGDIGTSSYQEFNFNLTVEGDGFKVVDSENTGDNMMYGVLAIDTKLVITGNLDLPIVNGTLGVTDETDFVFVIPQATPGKQEREGIVEFVDKDRVELNHTIHVDTFNTTSKVKGIDVSANIEVDEDAILSIVIDRANGDFVKLKGEGELTGGIDASGKTTLVGVYEVSEGSYDLTVGFMKRSFDIDEGSTIVWQGEPTEADLNITAVYETEAAPVDLLAQQISGLSKQEFNLYKQRLPFHVNLYLRGKLLEPEVEFDIQRASDNAGISAQVANNVSAKLQQLRTQDAELNKQVFALLLLNRFIGENPFQSEAGLSAEGMARQSVSQILSNQLNNLAGDLIQGVDLEFDLESREDYSTGELENRTDLNVNLSKQLLNDRLTVEIGSDFGLEGDARANEQTTNIAGDVSVAYQLSEDGKYILRAYRKNEYQVALQGQIIETGLSFIFTVDYDEFKEIFTHIQQNKELKRAKKQNMDDESK